MYIYFREFFPLRGKKIEYIFQFFPSFSQVDCYFSPSDGNYVKLYQDAHCLQGLPQFNQLSIFANEDPNFINYQPSSYFQDLRVALEEATQLICITGWAVYDKLHLLRGMYAYLSITFTVL